MILQQICLAPFTVTAGIVNKLSNNIFIQDLDYNHFDGICMVSIQYNPEVRHEAEIKRRVAENLHQMVLSAHPNWAEEDENDQSEEKKKRKKKSKNLELQEVDPDEGRKQRRKRNK